MVVRAWKGWEDDKVDQRWQFSVFKVQFLLRTYELPAMNSPEGDYFKAGLYPMYVCIYFYGPAHQASLGNRVAGA
jgi:hypothetical protein